MTKKQKKILLLAAVAVLLVAGVGGTVAYIVTHTNPVVNTFEATNVTVSVGTDGKITNNGNIDAFIRAAVVATWQDDDGKVYAQKPTVTVKEENSWDEIGGFYYYTSKVPAGSATSALSIDTSNAGDAPENGYTLKVEILAQGIQAEPAHVVSDVWGYTPSSN